MARAPARISAPLLEEERELRIRIALAVKFLTSAGYALIGGTFFKEVAEHHSPAGISYVWAGLGVGCLVFALWFAPMGAPRDE